MSSMEKKALQTKHMVISAMLCAVGVILLMLGSLFTVVDLSVAVVASLLCIWAVIEIGGFYPWLIWIVTSVLALLLVPQKSPALYYAFFLGYYPIVKEKIERKFALTLAIVCKLAVFHVSLLLMLLGMKLFVPAMLASLAWNWFLLVLYVASIVAFLVYDYALTKLISGYLAKLRRHFKLK